MLILSLQVSAKKFEEAFTQEETGLNMQKITDESSNSVYGHRTSNSVVKKIKSGSFFSAIASKAGASSASKDVLTVKGCCGNAGISWSTQRLLCMSPDGTELAYLSNVNEQPNIMIRKTSTVSTSTQRTFRSVGGFCWANNGNLYFADETNQNESAICVVNATKGTVMRQLTNGNMDCDPVLATDGKTLFFTRVDKAGPSIWCINLETNDIICCANGYNIALIGDRTDEFICVRNSTSGNSEIWLVNYVQGRETLLLSEKERGFSNPVLSPDGQWILLEGNSKSAISKKNNLDIFAVKIDGSSLIQLTYHPETDCCPVWSADGKNIYFISSRTNKKDRFNVWKMRFDVK